MQARACRLRLFIPGLFGPVIDSLPEHDGIRSSLVEGLNLPVTEMLLVRSEIVTVAAQLDTEALLYSTLTTGHAPTDPVPVAPLTYQKDGGEARKDWIMRADPVYLQPGAGDLTLVAVDDLELSETQAGTLCAAINAHFDDPNWYLESLTPQRWYIRCREPRALMSAPPLRALGRHVDEFLPRVAVGAHWMNWLNEVQMLLHASTVNDERAAAGQAPVNSLWLWGGARLPVTPRCEPTQMWTDHAFAGALAMHCGGSLHARPVDAAAWLSDVKESCPEQLIVLDQCAGLSVQGDIGAWREFLSHLEVAWWPMLVANLRQGRLDSVEIHNGTTRCFRLSRAGLRKWWRRRRPITRYMN